MEQFIRRNKRQDTDRENHISQRYKKAAPVGFAVQSAAGGTKNLKDNDRPNKKRESVDKKQADQKQFAYFRKHGEKKEPELCNLVITKIISFLNRF